MQNKLSEQLKKEYGSLEVPAEARERIIQGIKKAQSEERKAVPFKIAKRLGIGMAACLACTVLFVNSSPSAAMALEKIPVIGQVAKVVVFRTYDNQEGNFQAHMDVPEIVGESSGDGETIQATNKTIQEYADSLIQMYEKDLKASEGLGNYELASTYQVIQDTDAYLAIEIDTQLTMASGTEYKKVFNIDKMTGKIVALKDFFADGSNYKALISNDIKRQMKERMAADENVVFWIDSETPEWDFQEITDETSFYFNEAGNLCILFDEYEVAPGYMGAVSFTVDKAVFEKELK